MSIRFTAYIALISFIGFLFACFLTFGFNSDAFHGDNELVTFAKLDNLPQQGAQIQVYVSQTSGNSISPLVTQPPLVFEPSAAEHRRPGRGETRYEILL